MTIRLQYHRSCDRCARPFEDALIDNITHIPDRTGPRLRLLHDDTVCFDWRDLCPDCVKTVAGLMDRLRLTAPTKKKPGSIAEPISSEESTPPSTPAVAGADI